MGQKPYAVVPFSEQQLFAHLSNSRFSPDQVADHKRAIYLLAYLRDLKAQTIVVENDYIDGDYLDDFAAYYVKCFNPYERHCRRLHFFSQTIGADELPKLARSKLPPDDLKRLRDAYLGFIVARPLPDAIIGRTVLRTYDNDNGRRCYTCTHDYTANLFGLDLSVRSLAFQEQDTVLAACATVALWCCFHQAAHIFKVPAPRPAAITRAANVIMHHARPIPSHGLNVQQICNAIGSVGLEPEVIEVRKNTPLISLIYSHLRMGLPVLLGVRIEGAGMHAITLAGYSMRPTKGLKQEVAGMEKSIPMIGLRIDEFYAHDDQFGPFSRLIVKPSATVQNRHYPVMFEGQWIDKPTGKYLQMAPEIVVVPVYNKIRVTFLDVQKWLTRIHDLLKVFSPPNTDFEWDVQLTTTNDYKRAVQQEILAELVLEEVLFKQHPRFIWRAILRVTDKPLMEFLADATDMSRSLPIYYVIWHNQQLRAMLARLLGEPKLQPILSRVLSTRLLLFLKDQLAGAMGGGAVTAESPSIALPPPSP